VQTKCRQPAFCCPLWPCSSMTIYLLYLLAPAPPCRTPASTSLYPRTSTPLICIRLEPRHTVNIYTVLVCTHARARFYSSEDQLQITLTSMPTPTLHCIFMAHLPRTTSSSFLSTQQQSQPPSTARRNRTRMYTTIASSSGHDA
jgi:hypothetical protein